MADRQEWRETSLKGRMAESLVYDLLRESGNEIYKIGYEAILPGLTRIEESFRRNSNVGEKIRAIPDFFVIDGNKDPHLVEVKFRWSPQWHPDDDERLKRIRQNWEETIIVHVNCHEKPYFRICYPPFKEISGSLAQVSAFNISQELLDKFDVLVEKYLKPTLHKQII
ncbi:MAG: hypothetical protein Q7K44_02560 [Candidatus Liptonbacteria bacterium]|nr:hypothetical protein [Candidatus Liptonbacteria bacterium]